MSGNSCLSYHVIQLPAISVHGLSDCGYVEYYADLLLPLCVFRFLHIPSCFFGCVHSYPFHYLSTNEDQAKTARRVGLEKKNRKCPDHASRLKHTEGIVSNSKTHSSKIYPPENRGKPM